MGAPLVLAALATPAAAQSLPSCGSQGKKSALIRFDQGSGTAWKGIGMVAPIRAKNGSTDTTDNDYLMVPFSRDDGKGGGGLRFLDVSTFSGDISGKSPTVAGQRYDNSDIREVHGLGFTEMFGDDWKTVVVPSTKGFFVFDIDNIATVSQKAHYQIMSAANGGAGSSAVCSGTCAGSYNAAPSSGTYNYDNGVAWHLAVAAPYIYVANAENGLNVYKWGGSQGTISWVKRYDSSVFGGQRVSQVWAFGRVLVVGAVEVGAMFAVMDISNPANPVLKDLMRSSDGAERVYGLTVNGYRIYGAGKDDNTSNGGTNNIQIYDLTFDANNVVNGITKRTAMASGLCGEGGYLSFQDGYVHGGYGNCYEKWNASNPSSLTEASGSNATLGVTGSDLDFVTHFNNMVFLGNDHEGAEGGSMIMCHTGTADTTAPAVNAVSPRDGSTGVPVTSMVGLSFSDQLRMSTITGGNLTVRKKDTTTALGGHYSYWLNLVNFAPASNLEAGTTYEIVVGSGLKDLAGNSAAAATYEFTTAGSAPAPTGKIASLTVHDTANAAGWSIQSNFAAGSSSTGSHPWSDYPNSYVASIDGGVASLAGKEWIRVAAASKNYTGGPQATITLSATANVYIMVDDRWGTAPTWTSGWTNTSSNVSIYESSTRPSLPFSVFRKSNVSGSVTVPQIGANTAYDYFIVVE